MGRAAQQDAGGDVAGAGAPRPPRRRLVRFFAIFAGVGWWRALVAGLLSGLGWVLAFPPVSLWGATLLAAWPAVWIGARAADASRPAWRTGLWFALGTLPAWAWLTRWAAQGSVMGFPILVAYLGLFAGLTVWAFVRVRRSWPRLPLVLVVPVVWVGMEYVRGRVAFDGFPWFLLAHPLIDAPGAGSAATLAWPAALIGTYAVSGLAAFAAAWLETLRRAPRSGAAWATGLLVVVWVAGAWWPRASIGPGRDSFRVALVQTNLPQSVRGGWPYAERLEDWRNWRQLLADAARGDEAGPPDVVVFPETMFPGLVLQADAAEIERAKRIVWLLGEDAPQGVPRVEAWLVRDDLLRMQSSLGVPVLMGAPRFEGFDILETDRGFEYHHDRNYNSVFLIEDGEVNPEAYDKRHLTPFGEVMPYISAWPWLESRLLDIAARGMRFDLEAGEGRRVFELGEGGGFRCVTPICFEATLPQVCRTLVFDAGRRRAGVMINVTNDGWFYEVPGGRELHMLAARWRCVELATPMARAANTGVSSAIDARGRVTAALEPFTSGVLPADLTPGSGVTVYGRIGDITAIVCLFGAILGLAASYTPFRRGGRIRTDRPAHDEESGVEHGSARAGSDSTGDRDAEG